MKVNVLLSPLSVDELYFSGKTTVVIDVLRASTTIVNMLRNGAIGRNVWRFNFARRRT